MALELHLWESAHFGDNLRQGKDVYVGVPGDARSASSQRPAARAGGDGRGARHTQRCALTLTWLTKLHRARARSALSHPAQRQAEGKLMNQRALQESS